MKNQAYPYPEIKKNETARAELEMKPTNGGDSSTTRQSVKIRTNKEQEEKIIALKRRCHTLSQDLEKRNEICLCLRKREREEWDLQKERKKMKNRRKGKGFLPISRKMSYRKKICKTFSIKRVDFTHLLGKYFPNVKSFQASKHLKTSW